MRAQLNMSWKVNSLGILPFLLLPVFNFPLVESELDYFPKGFFPASDVTNVKWAHGVNSQIKLYEVIYDPTIRMIEADVSRGRLNSSGVIGPFDIAIMAHPPANTSDLSLKEFVDRVIAYNAGKSLRDRKGMKLDFKDYFGATRAALYLRSKLMANADLNFPIWLNADVLKGPVASQNEPKIDGEKLLRLHSVNFPQGVLSLGWTTRFGLQSGGEMITEGQYTREHVEEMIEVFQNYSQSPETTPVTYALRAGLAENSLPEILYLLNRTSRYASVTLWAGSDDPPVDFNSDKWQDFFKVIGKGSTFVDVPFSWQFNSAPLRFINIHTFIFSFVICCLLS